MRSFLLSVFLCALAACGGGGSDVANQDDNPAPNPGGNPAPNPNPGGGGPAPSGPTVAFDETATGLGKLGAFPSALTVDGLGRLFTVDDAGIPASVLGFASDGSTAPLVSVAIKAADLIDMDGSSPARSATAFGPGLFGAFTGDIEVAFNRYLLVTVGAGNSISTDGTNFLRLANLVVIDTQTATVVQTINLAWPLRSDGDFSAGGSYQEIPQSLPVMCAFVPATNGTPTGRVYVAMSNGAGSSAGLANFFRGTVQEWRADFTANQPLSIETAGKAATDVTRTFVSDHYNPVGLTRYTAANQASYLVLTVAGASLFSGFVVQPTTDALLEFLDLDANLWRSGWARNLGAILPAAQRIAMGKDATGAHFGVLTSQTYGAAYIVDLHGLEGNPVDQTRLGLLRTVELAPGAAALAGSDFLPGVAVTPSGSAVVISSFNTASLTVLTLPADVALGPILVNPAPFDVSLGTSHGLGLGALVAPAGAAADVYVIVNGAFDASFAPSRQAFIGALTTDGQLP